MKTMNEFIKELTAKKELQEEMSKIKNNDELAAFLKANDCEATTDDFWAIAEIIEGKEGELPDELAEVAAGGFPFGMSNPEPAPSLEEAAKQRSRSIKAKTREELLRELGVIK